MSNKESNIEKTNFDAFIQAVGSEIEQAQVRLIVAANAQMLFHYWKVGNYILYHQQLHGWGSKIIKQLAKAIRLHYPEKKGYSERNLTYMCQFAKAYPLRAFIIFMPVLQFLQSLADGGIRKRAYPQAAEGQRTARIGIQVSEYQFSFAII